MPLTHILPSGLAVELDESLTAYALCTTDIPIPNTALHDILDLLTGGSYAGDLNGQIAAMQKHLRGCYELCALWMVKPRLVLPRMGAAGADDYIPGVGPLKLSSGDAIALFSFFRVGELRDVGFAARNEPDSGAATAGDGGADEQAAE